MSDNVVIMCADCIMLLTLQTDGLAAVRCKA